MFDIAAGAAKPPTALRLQRGQQRVRVVVDARVEFDRQCRRVERGDRRPVGAGGDGVLHGEGRGAGERAVPRQDRPSRPGDFMLPAPRRTAAVAARGLRA
ncbi:MAG: hypothetical protein ACK5AL_16795 [Planctomycetota bacterium]